MSMEEYDDLRLLAKVMSGSYRDNATRAVTILESRGFKWTPKQMERARKKWKLYLNNDHLKDGPIERPAGSPPWSYAHEKKLKEFKTQWDMFKKWNESDILDPDVG